MVSIDAVYVLYYKQQVAEAAVCSLQHLRSDCCCNEALTALVSNGLGLAAVQ